MIRISYILKNRIRDLGHSVLGLKWNLEHNVLGLCSYIFCVFLIMYCLYAVVRASQSTNTIDHRIKLRPCWPTNRNQSKFIDFKGYSRHVFLVSLHTRAESRPCFNASMCSICRVTYPFGSRGSTCHYARVGPLEPPCAHTNTTWNDCRLLGSGCSTGLCCDQLWCFKCWSILYVFVVLAVYTP